ncbi:MAG: signal peptidase II [bacterium]
MKRLLDAAPRLLAASICVFALDQFTKVWVVRHVGEGPFNSVNILGGWVQLLYTENKGLILGLGRDSPFFVNFVIGIASIILIVYALSELRRGTNAPALIGVGMIFGGAAGNLSDRVRLGYVIDFISIGRWPVFNFADASIVTGVFVLIISYYFEEQAARTAADEEARKAAEEAATAAAAAEAAALTETQAPTEGDAPARDDVSPLDLTPDESEAPRGIEYAPPPDAGPADVSGLPPENS